MSDVDFLPNWYRDLLKRRRQSLLNLAALALLVAVLATAAVFKTEQVTLEEHRVAAVQSELEGARQELQKLSALTQLRDQWRRQDSVLSSTGVNVEASRLLAALEQVVPADTALTDLTFTLEDRTAQVEPEVEGQQPAPTIAADAPGAGRRLKVSLRGLAPGELAVANLLSAISKTSLFTQVNLNYAKDHEEAGETVRQFEVTFVINLASEPADQGVAGI